MAQVSRVNVFIGLCCISACLECAYSQASTTSNTEQSCSDLPGIENGISYLVNTSDPSTGAFVLCNFGYETTKNFIYCLSTGIWEEAACTEIDCGPVPEVENGYVQQVDLSNATYGGVATVICNIGYTPLVEELICLETGQWEDLEFYAACIIIDCGKVPDIENGQVVLDQPSNSSYGSVALVMCDIGHEALAAELMCLESGMWEGEELFALCTAKDCGAVPDVEHGHIVLDELSNSTYGSIAHVVCDTGYVAFVELLSCLETGQWEDWESFAGCNAIECDKKPNVTNGEVSLDNGENTYGALGYIQCNVGYNSTSLNITCTENGTWEYAACSVIDCGFTPNISNGATVLNDESNSTFGAVAWVTCFSGFSSTIDAITCLESGAWESIAMCESIECGQPLNISDGFLELHHKDNTSVGALASVVCDPGYISNVTTVSCTDSGLWGGNVTCEPVECGIPQPVPHGQVELLSNVTTTYGAEALILCDIGYMTNITYIRCEDTGEWSYTSPCTRIDCGPLPVIDNGVLTLQDVSNTTYGASAAVDCDTGYQADTDRVSCTDTGLWENWEEFVICSLVDCGPVPGFTNGIAVIEEDDTHYETTATIVCDNGYIVNSSDIIRCEATGNWSDAVCVLNECSPNPLIENGVILLPGGAPTVGIVAMVTCDSGYFGNVDVIECLPAGEWEEAICSNTDCGEVPDIENGFIMLAEVNMTTFGSLADVICDDGFVSSLPTIECQIDGTWQNDARCTGYGLGAVTIETGEEKTDDQHLTYLKCAFSIFVGLTYRIKWYYNGYVFHDTGIISWQDATIFRFSDEDLLAIPNVPILGSTISCMASVHDGIGAELENQTSVDFVPMEISTTELTMIRGQTATLSVSLHVPFGCPLTSSECSLRFLVYDPNDNYECYDSSIAVVSKDTCGGKVLMTNADSTSFTSTVTNITLTTKNNRSYRLRSYFRLMIKMSAIGNSKSVWNQELTDLTVHVEENDLTKYRGCYAFVDPYMYTFDRRYYSNQLIEEFVMFRHKTLPIEVQTMTAPCNWNRATCSCSVTVRAGGDVFTINHCGGHMTGYLSHNDGILRVYRWYSSYYQIVLPTGMQVYVYVMPYFDYTMNVYIIPAHSDFNQSDGLCGNFNGEQDDDTLLRGTNTPSSVEGNQGSGWWWWWWWSDYFFPHDFAYSWGLQTTQRQDESLLNPDVYENVESWAEEKKLCVCPNLPNEEIPESLCSADEEATCMGRLWWRYGTLLTPSSVQKRHAVDDMPTHLATGNTRKRLIIMTQKWDESRQLYGHHILKRQVANTTAISVDEGKAICQEQLNSSCNAYTKKEDVKDIADPDDNLQNCGQDVAIDGSAEWTQPHCDAYTQKVTSELEKDVEFAEANEELTQNIKDKACPGNCSGNGDCVKGFCECYEGFGTDLCLIDLSVAPILEDYGDEGLCDVSTGSTCEYILVVGNGFIEEAWCNVSLYIAEYDGQFLLVRNFVRPCVYVNFNEVYAPTFDVDENVRRRRREVGNADAALARMIGISVSNDGMNYGETKYVVVLDTTCQQTDVNTTENSVVTLKSGYCYISGTCYTQGSFFLNSMCDVCDTSTDAFVWTNACVSGLDAEDDTDRMAIILGSVFGSVLIIAVITITGIFLLKKSKRNNTPAPSMPSNINYWFSKKASLQPNVLTKSDSLLGPRRKMSVGIAGGTDFGEEHC